MNDAKTMQQKTVCFHITYQDLFIGGIAYETLTDFEKAAQNALVSSVWRKIQDSCLKPRYENDPEFRLQMKSLPALSFVPPAKVEDAFNDLVATMPNTALPVLSYFEDNYIRRVMRGSHQIPPLFEPGLWNNYNRVLQDLPRTTNAVEGFHSSFLKNCDGLHLNFFTYLRRLQQENNKHEVSIIQRIAGAPPPPRKKYLD
ncbi:unnamed protein product, partial [Darwinula stevensoni]